MAATTVVSVLQTKGVETVAARLASVALSKVVETHAVNLAWVLHKMDAERLPAAQAVQQRAAQGVRTLQNQVGEVTAQPTVARIARTPPHRVVAEVARRDAQMTAATHVSVYVQITVIIYAKTHVPEGVIILA